MGNLFSTTINGKEFKFQPIEFGQQSGYRVEVEDEEGTLLEFSLIHVDAADASKMKLEGIGLPPWIMNELGTLIKFVNEQS